MRVQGKKFIYAVPLLSLTIAALLFSAVLTSAFAARNMNRQHHNGQEHISAKLYPVNRSGVEGFVDLKQLKNTTGTDISLDAFGLMPGNTYVSLYYGNHVCNLEPYSASDVIGGIYTANSAGVGATHGTATDNLDEINSVSVRDSGTFHLLACSNVHPGK